MHACVRANPRACVRSCVRARARVHFAVITPAIHGGSSSSAAGVKAAVAVAHLRAEARSVKP